MVMTSKFAGRCKACGISFPAGMTIEWTREAGARHITANGCEMAKLIAAAAAPVAVVEAPKVDASSVVAFLTAAKDSGLKFPKARFLAPDGVRELRLSLAGAGSKAPGSVQVVVGEQWIGRINADGAVVGSLATNGAVLATLAEIVKNPAAAAKAYGALMSRCSFCNLQLTDAGSVEVGYGPVCAKHYGLPHTAKGTPSVHVVEHVEADVEADDVDDVLGAEYYAGA